MHVNLFFILMGARNRVKGRKDKQKCQPGELLNVIGGYPLSDCSSTVRDDAVLILLGDKR